MNNYFPLIYLHILKKIMPLNYQEKKSVLGRTVNRV